MSCQIAKTRREQVHRETQTVKSKFQEVVGRDYTCLVSGYWVIFFRKVSLRLHNIKRNKLKILKTEKNGLNKA